MSPSGASSTRELVQPMTAVAAMRARRLAISADAGHLPQVDHPDDVGAAIERHLRELAQSA
ncbi:MAG: hypothetical protein ACI4XG_10575 [Bradyrhizobium sp.]